MPPPLTVAELRSLLATRFPERLRRSEGCIATGVRAIDTALGGGLPAGCFTELVSSTPGTGGQTTLVQLLGTTRRARQRVALIDAANGFVADDVPPDRLRHLVWVRAHGANEAFAAADIVVRDGNYAVVVLDLRGLAERTLQKTPATTWHRLRHAVEAGSTAMLVQTAIPLVPTVPWRLILQNAVPLAARQRSRSELADGLTVEVARARPDVMEQSA